MKFVDAKPEEIPKPDNVTIEFEHLNSQLRSITFCVDGAPVFKIVNPSSYESLKCYKPAPPKMKQVWRLTATTEGLPASTSDWEHEFEAESAAGKFNSNWKTEITKTEIEVKE